MSLLSINKESQSFNVSIEAKGRRSIWEIFPNRSGVDSIVMNMDEMQKQGIQFHIGSLASTHHKLSLKDFTSQRLASIQSAGVDAFLIHLMNLEIISKFEMTQIINQLSIQSNLEKPKPQTTQIPAQTAK